MQSRLVPLFVSPAALGYAADNPLLKRPGVTRAIEWLRENHEKHFERQLKIAQIPAPPFEEAERAAWVFQEFRRIGLADCEIDPKGNVLGWRHGSSAQALVAAAHLDTVFPPGTDVRVKQNGKRWNGPGLADDTRGLAVLLALAEALDVGNLKTRRSILFVADVGEEGIGNLRGIHYLFDESKYRDRLDAFISIDGVGDSKIVSREIGSRRYRLTISGPGGHSWENFGRVNPGHALGRIIGKLSEMDVGTHPKTSYNVGRMGGGTSVNSVPFEAWMEFDMRSEDEQTLIELERKFLDIVKEGVERENLMRAKSGTKLTYDAKQIGLRHAIATGSNAGLVQAVHEADRALGLPPSEEEWGSTDSNAAASAGKPAITLGGGGDGGNFHSLEEWFEPENAWRGVQRALLTVLAYDVQ